MYQLEIRKKWNKYGKISEKNLKAIMEKYFNLNTVLVELEGVIEGHINLIKANCQYNYKNGILYLLDILNNLKIDIASQYEILFDENKRKLKIKLDNGQNLILIEINKKRYTIKSVSFKINQNEFLFQLMLKLKYHHLFNRQVTSLV